MDPDRAPARWYSATSVARPRAVGWLDRPIAYDLTQRLAGKPKVCRVFVTEYLRPVAGARILDLACGTGELLRYLPPMSYLGVDINGRYVEQARARHGHCAQFICGDIVHADIPDASFDLVTAVGVLHHLNDDVAAVAVGIARRALRDGGRFVVLEPCRLDGQSLVARAIIALDRGKFVRNSDGYEALLRRHFDDVRPTIRLDLLVLPSAQIIYECRSTIMAR
jgi:SAM-dependent methyltransferase